MLGVLTHSQRRLKTPQFCAKIFYTSNTPQSRAIAGLNVYFVSQSYPLSINTRITRENWAKNEHENQRFPATKNCHNARSETATLSTTSTRPRTSKNI